MKTIIPFFLLIFICSTYTQGQNAKDLSKLSYIELDTLYESRKAQAKYKELLPYAQAGWEKAEKEYGQQDTTTAKWLYNLGYAYDYGVEDYQKALDFYSQAASIQKNKMPTSLSYANTLFTIGGLYNYVLGEYTLAEPLYLQALEIKKQKLGGQHLDYANSLYDLAGLYHRMGNYIRAEVLFSELMNIPAWSSHPYYATSLNYFANSYENIGNLTKAEALYLQAMEMQKKAFGEGHPNYATSLSHLASLNVRMENYSKAEPLYLQSISIQKNTLGEGHPDYALNLHNLAHLYTEMKLYTKAEPLHLQAIAIQKNVLGEGHPDYARSLNSLAVLYYIQKLYTKAEPLYLEAIAIHKKNLGEEHLAYTTSLYNLAFLYQMMGDYAKAEPMLLKVLTIQKNTLGNLHPDYARILTSVASLYKSMGKLDTAFNYCRLGILANAPGIDSSFTNWENLDTIHYISNAEINYSINILLSILYAQYEKSQAPEKLKTHYLVSQAAIRLNERFRKEFTSEEQKLRTLAESNGFVLSAIKTGIKLRQPGYEATAFGFAEMNKGVLLLESAKTANAQQFAGLPDAIIEQEKSLQKQHSSLTAKLLEKRTEAEKDSLRIVLNKTNQEIDVFTKMLKNKFPKYAELKYGGKTVNAKEIQALFDDKTALLEYMIGDSVVYIFYIDKKQVKLTPIYLSNNILNDKIKTLHHVLSDYNLAANESAISYQKYTTTAFWFYDNLIKPALSNAKGINKLIIVSDGELGHLPFEAFLTKSAPQTETDYRELHYLSNDYKISYNYSATIWKTAKETSKNKNNGQILGMASNYEINLKNSVKNTWRLPYEQRLRDLLKPLPAARKEIETLSERFNGFFAFDKEASEKNFKAKAADYAIIHLAMHGLLDSKNPILSSLAFTEDGDSLENNFLQAYEISKIKLNADLVVLSACETGYGRFEKGNGIASLAQAFAYAGAPAMIVSLWQVSDYATSEIMKNLYQNLADGMEKDEALQQAKIKYIKEAKGVLAHPAFWSPFILMGNTDAVYLKTKGGWLWWGIGITILVLASTAFAMRNRKKE